MACRLPGRPVVVANEGWQQAVDELESELKTCAAQVLDCIERQSGQGAVTESAARHSSAN